MVAATTQTDSGAAPNEGPLPGEQRAQKPQRARRANAGLPAAVAITKRLSRRPWVLARPRLPPAPALPLGSSRLSRPTAGSMLNSESSQVSPRPSGPLPLSPPLPPRQPSPPPPLPPPRGPPSPPLQLGVAAAWARWRRQARRASGGGGRAAGRGGRSPAAWGPARRIDALAWVAATRLQAAAALTNGSQPSLPGLSHPTGEVAAPRACTRMLTCWHSSAAADRPDPPKPAALRRRLGGGWRGARKAAHPLVSFPPISSLCCTRPSCTNLAASDLPPLSWAGRPGCDAAASGSPAGASIPRQAVAAVQAA